MAKIFLLSDTHGHWNDEWIKYINSADEIWHAGDIGSEECLHKIISFAQNKPARIVYGNIDNQKIRIQTKEYLVFETAGTKVLITHIAGTFGKYNEKTKQLLYTHQPDILVCGHSHILKIQYDKKFNCWYINPGAAGTYGFHLVCTALFFEIIDKQIKNMNIIEWKK